MELNKIQSNGSWGKAADDLNQNFSKVDKAVEQVKNATTRNKGYFSTDAALKSAFNSASLGDIAYVGSTYPYQIWAWNGTEWENTHENGGQESVNLGDYYTKEDTDKKLSELGSEVDGLSKDVDNLKEETSNSYKLVDITDELSVGAYVFTGRKGDSLSASELNDGSFRRIKADVVSGDKFVLTGTGTGQNYTSGERITEDLTGSVKNGTYTYSSTNIGDATTATHSYNGGWRCIEQPVKANERYIITGTGGGGARLYCLVSSAGVIKAIAESDEVQSNFELVVDEDGILYCNFNNSNNYDLVKEYTVTISTESVSSIWANGSYEFGGTCNLDYTAPDIDRYSLPSAGEIVNAVYAWYDGLVSAFPNYVSREDCDAVMATLGISKPSAISDLPMYMYKFIPPKSPNSSGFAAVDSDANRIKAFIITGAHPEYTAVWDCYNAMKLVCEKWKEDKNLEELRWNADIYIIPCYNLYGVNNTTRTNENGVDLNRNAPTKEWAVQGSLGDSTYSGTEAGSEYSTKVLIHYLGEIKPQIFIDHHNTNVGSGTSEGDGKNMIYTHCIYQLGIDISNVLITQMTRKWKMRFSDTFPSVDSDNTIFGYTLFDHIKGSIGRYCAEQGCLGSTYESNFGILYKNGIYSTDNRQTNTSLVSTCATEGFINYLLRSLRAYSVFVGVNALELPS